MPLPASWKGVFWGPETMGHLLVDVPPEEFTSFLADYPDDPVFLVSGGVFDLRLNGMTDLAERIILAAKKQWPEVQWNPLSLLIGLAVEKFREMEPNLLMENTPRMYALLQHASVVYRPVTPAS